MSIEDTTAAVLSDAPEIEFAGVRMFAESANRVVSYLNEHTPLTDWSVSRLAEGEQIHLHVAQDDLLSTGDRIAWTQSFCSRMAAGAAHVVPDPRRDPNYADLPAAATVGAYAGYTISDSTGEVFGVLCGIRSQSLSPDEEVDEQLVRLFSELLTTQLELSRDVDRERRQSEIAEASAQSDPMTGAMNRRGWDRVVTEAQGRLDGFGDPVAVAVVDLDGLKTINDSLGHSAGDEFITRAASALQRTDPVGSLVARIGGDEFVVLSDGVTPRQAEPHFAAFMRALEAAGVSASLGFAAAEPGILSIAQAVQLADRRMYESKQQRKAQARIERA